MKECEGVWRSVQEYGGVGGSEREWGEWERVWRSGRTGTARCRASFVDILSD